MNILKNCFDKYIETIVENFSLDKELITNYVKNQNWEFKIKKEKYLADIYYDYHGNKYYLIDNTLGIKINE